MKLTRLYIPLVLALLALGLPVAGCGSSAHPVSTPASSQPPADGGTTSTAPASTQSASTQSAASTSTPSAQTAPPGGPAGGPVPRAFDPVSFTAISERRFWLLGTAPCSSSVCTSIVRTTDGGAHFVGIPAPRAQLASPTGPGLAQLRFADPLDGFAGDDGPAGPLWETHDGGAHWQVGLDDVMVFTVSAGHVYALTGRCGSGACSGLELAVSPASGDHWTTAALPSAAASGFPAITAHGSSVWISLTPATASARSQTLLYSDYAGVHPLVAMASPCVPGLGGDLQASSDQVVWAVCPTGMMAGAWRSTDAGRHWSPLSGRTASGRRLAMSNGARLAPSSDTGAVLATGDTGELLRTTDAGASFATVVAPSPSGAQWMWIGFTDPQTGTALRADQGPAVGPTHVSPASLWRSSDGGASWHGPIAIG